MTDVEIRVAREDEWEQWDQFIDSSPSGTIFHKYAWLNAAEEETKTDLKLLLGYWKKNPIFALPLFVKRILGFRFVFSPPPKCLIPDMGLVLNFGSEQQGAFEQKYFSAVDAIDTFIKSELKADFIRIVNPVELSDMRPFIWNNYRISPRYTYFIPLEEKGVLFQKMKSQVRRNIRRAQKYSGLEIVAGGRDTYFELIQLVRERYAEQNLCLPVSDTYLGKIHNVFSKEMHIITKGAQHDGSLLTGLILLKYKKKIQYWIGGVVPKEKFTGINELLHWLVIQESNGFLTHYDLVGANTKHLCHYKSKFNPELKTYFQVEKGKLMGNTLKLLYEKCFAKDKGRGS